MNVTSDWVDVCIKTQLDAGDILSRLDDPAVQGAWEEAGTVHLYWPERQWNGDRLASVKSALSQLGAGGGDIRLSVNRVPYQDWNQQWARSVKPLHIGRLVIRPSWEPAILAPGDLEIVLDPKQAFGTGHHATTRMLLEWLQDGIHGGDTVVDVGTGSGILALAAVKLGGASVVAVDSDPVAVECALDYVSVNGLHDRIQVICGTLDAIAGHAKLPPTLVLANLDRRTLLELSDSLAVYAHDGARLWLSGILVDQQAEIVERFVSLGLACSRRREQEGWMALELITAESCEGVF